MKLSRHIIFCFSFTLFCGCFQYLAAQPGYKIDIKKPKPYENRVLKAEKTGDGKLKQPKKFFQNLTTHYNYVFNATNKLNDVVYRAKAAHKDDYSTLLPFYNYSLENTKGDVMQLDSVIYKAQTGIVMHDLRNEWGDDLYLLWGAAYFLRDQLDSAAMMFQFINYAYAEKEKDGYYKYIGSPQEGETSLTIATKEKQGIFANTSSRNNAFIWQIKTSIYSGNNTEASSMINTLKHDSNFPKRLHLALEEMQSYLFYKQQRWDSAATHLTIAANGAEIKLEKARWEYLAAQMFELAGKLDDAQKLYAQSIAHTTDPVMEVYARLNLVRINKSGYDNYIDQNIAELLKMAKRDKYEDYRDVIYYMAAQMEMERGNLPAAQALLLKAAKYNSGNIASRNKAFLQIANLAYDQRKYIQAASYYDSLQVRDLNETELASVNERKPIASKISRNLLAINRQDSVQKIAAMPEAERNAFLNRMVKQLRKQQGLKDEPITSGRSTTTTIPDLFTGQAKGEWYFYNNNLKNQGSQQFKQIWGSRPNVDNWRRFSSVSQQLVTNNPNNTRDVVDPNNLMDDDIPNVEALSSNLPLTAEGLQKSNDSIVNALNTLGSIYLNEARDFKSAIETLEELRSRFPDFEKMDEVLFNLYYAYTKAGDISKASQIKRLITEKYPNSRFASIVTIGKDPAAKTSQSPEATRDYESVYNSFIEGNFTKALEDKKRADSTYKTNYWQPQLLYIEAVYHLKQREDSLAKNVLQTLVTQNANTPLGKKAENLLQVLARRQQIETELAQYQIQNSADVPAVQQQEILKQQPVITPPAVVKKDSVIAKPIQKPADTIAKKTVTPPPAAAFTFNASEPHYAIVLLNKVDPVFVGEAKNAFNRFNKEKLYNQPLDVQLADVNAENRLVLVGSFANASAAVDYIQMVKKLAASEIVPWLAADKYSFSIITSGNLTILKTNPDVNAYKKFVAQYFPGKL